MSLKKLINLVIWSIRNDLNCNFYDRCGNFEYILFLCILVLIYGRYRWRYDEVLFVFVGVFKKIKVEILDDK